MPMGVALYNVLPLFALRLGARTQVLGIIYALLWITDLLQYLASPEVGRRAKKRWMTMAYSCGAIVFSGLFVIPLVLPGLHSSLSIAGLLVVVGLYSVCTSLALTGWAPYVLTVIPLSVTGQFLGKVSAVHSMSWLASAVAASLFLGRDPALWRFYAFFGLACAGVCARVVLAAGLPPDPVMQVPGNMPKRLDALLAPLKDPAMSRYAALALGLAALLSVSRPLVPAYFSVSLGVPDAMNVIILAAPFLAAALFGRAIGRLADRRGFHLLITVGMVIAGVSALATAVLSRFVNVAVVGALGLGALICSGMGIAVVEIALGRERFARTKPGFESEFLGLGNAVIGVGAAVGSIVGGALPDLCLRLAGAQDVYRGLFVAHSMLLFLVAGVFLLISVVTPRRLRGVGQP